MDLSSINLTAEQISEYLNIGLAAFAAFALIGFLIGCIKGFWKQSFSFLYYLICFGLLIFFVKDIALLIYNVDVYGIAKQAGVTIQGFDETINTVGKYLKQLITQLLESNNVQATDDLFIYTESIALSIIQFAIYIVGLILIIVTEIIIAPILYHLIFKWFVPKKVRKERKARLLGGLVGAVEYVLVFTLLLTPFSALINAMIGNLRDDEGNIQKDPNNTDEVYQLLTNFLEGYNNSILANALFSVTIDGKTLDVALMDYITGTNFSDDLEFKIYDEFGEMSSILVDLISTGALDLSTQSLNIAVLVESAFIKNTFYTLAESSLVNIALPLVATLALSSVNGEVDLSNIDLSGVDWSSTLCTIGDVFDAIKETGYVQTVLTNPDGFMETIVINRENEIHLKNALSSFGNSNLVNTLMPQLIVSYLESMKDTEAAPVGSLKKNAQQESNETSGFDVGSLVSNLPDEAYEIETYQDIRWGDELTTMLEVVLKISDQITGVKNQELTLASVMNIFSPDLLTGTLFGVGGDTQFETASDYEDNPYINGGVINGYTIPGTKAILGCSDDATSQGLFDLKILEKILIDFEAMPNVVPMLFDMIGEDLIGDSSDIQDKIVTETASWNMQNWKDEFASLIPLATPLLNTVSAMNTGDVVANLTASKTLAALNYFVDNLEASFLLNEVAPDVLQGFVSSEKNNMDLFFGLKLGDLNFNTFSENHSFATEIKYIVTELLPKVGEVMSLVEDGFGVDLIIDNSNLLSSILSCVYQCEITNRPLTFEEESMGKISNFETMMVNLFHNPTQEEIDNGFDTSFNVPTITSGLFYFDKATLLDIDGNWVLEDGSGEIASLFNFFASIKDKNASKNYIYDIITGGESDLTNDVFYMGDEIERLFSAIDESRLLKEAFPNTISKAMEDSPLSSMVDFYNVEDWTYEGQAFASVLNTLNEIRNGSSDIAEVILNCDSDLIKEYDFENESNADVYQKYNGNYDKYFLNESKAYRLLKNINSTQSINLQDLIYDTLGDTLSPEEEASPIVDRNTYLSAEEDFKFAENTHVYQTINTANYYVSWDYEANVAVETGYYGEIYNLSRILTYASSLEDFSSLNHNTLNDLLTVCVKSYPMKKIIGPVIENALNEIKNGSTDMVANILNACDFQVFDRLTSDIRSEEIEMRLSEVDAICEVYQQKDSLADINNDFESNVINLTKVDSSTNESKLTRLLNKMHDSEIFNSELKIKQVDSSSKRNTLTAFEVVFQEIFKMKADLFEEVTNEDIYALNNKQTNDKWINSSSSEGEILNFNNAIYNTMSSEIYEVVINGGASYDSLKDLYKGPSSKHLENLSLNLSQSILLSKQLAKIYDDFIYSSLKDNIAGISTDGNYQLANNPYSSYAYVTGNTVDWGNEGSIIDDLIKKIALSGLDFTSSETSQFISDDIKYIFDTLDQSDVLHYSSSEITLDSSIEAGKERSFNEFIVCLFESKVIDKFYDSRINIFDIENIDNQKTYITTRDIESYENEEDIIYRFVAIEKQLTDCGLYNADGFTFTSYSSLDKNTLLSLADLIDDLYTTLSDSKVFNFKIKGGSTDYIKGEGVDAYKNRTTYEHAVIYLSKQIRNTIVDTFGLNTSDGYIINNTTHDLLTSVHQFVGEGNEQDVLIDIIRKFADVVDVLGGTMDIDSVSLNKVGIRNIISSIGKSKILNHTSTKVTNDLSLFDDVSLYLINKVNTSLVEALSISNNSASVVNIRDNLYLKDNADYQEELNLILDDGGLIDIASEMDLQNTNVEFKIDRLNDPDSSFSKARVLALLETVYQSKCMNYTRGADGYVGRLTSNFDELSVFEDVMVHVFAQENIVELVYDEHNLLQDSYLPTGSKNGLSVIKHKIKEINDRDSSYLTNVYFFDTNSYEGEISKLFNFLGGISDSSNLEFTNIDEAVGSLKNIAKIYVLHDMVAKQIYDITTTEQIANTEKIKTISDLAIVNTPDYYTFEYDGNIKHTYSRFETCANMYDDELDAIISLKEVAASASISGDLNSLNVSKDDTLFEDLLFALGTSQIYQPIAPDSVVKIFEQMSINALGIKYQLASFISADSTLEPSDEEEKELYRTNLVINNFVMYDYDYKLIGSSLDDFLYYAYSYVIRSPSSKLTYNKNGVMDELLGFHMAENFDKLISSIILPFEESI